MDLRDFRYFVAVAEELHFSRAAQRLNISQPPLSKHIQDMEEKLGAVLLSRTKRRVELTDAGRIFLVEARAALAQAKHAIETVQRVGRGELGNLRIGFTVTAAYTPFFPRAVRAYRSASPGVNLKIKYMTSELILESLLSGELDIGLLRPSSSLKMPREIKAITVMKDMLTLALDRDNPLAKLPEPIPIRLLARESFILRPKGLGSSFYEQVYDLCTLAGFTPKVAQEAHEAPTVLGLVAAGLGITILPASLKAINVDEVVWRSLTVKDGTLESAVLLVFNANVAESLQRSQFIKLVQSHI